MAAEYDRWTDIRQVAVKGMADEFQEILGDKMTVSFSEGMHAITFAFDSNNKLVMSSSRDYMSFTVNGSSTRWMSEAVSSIKYFAKRSGELLITSTGTKLSCAQVAIGPCSDGSWGMVAVSCPANEEKYDKIYLTCSNMPPYSMEHSVTNRDMPNKIFLSLRKIVLREDVMFNNIYINNYGYTDPWSVIQFDGERYAAGNGQTGNHVDLLMRL